MNPATQTGAASNKKMTPSLRELLADLASRLDLDLGEFDLDRLAVALAIRLIMTREGRRLDADT